MFLISKEKYEFLCANSAHDRKTSISTKTSNSNICDRPCNCENSSNSSVSGHDNKDMDASIKSPDPPQNDEREKQQLTSAEYGDEHEISVAPKKLNLDKENTDTTLFHHKYLNPIGQNKQNKRTHATKENDDGDITLQKAKLHENRKDIEPSQEDTKNKKRKRSAIYDNGDDDHDLVAPKKSKLENKYITVKETCSNGRKKIVLCHPKQWKLTIG